MVGNVNSSQSAETLGSADMYLFRQEGGFTHGGVCTRSNVEYAITHLYETRLKTPSVTFH